MIINRLVFYNKLQVKPNGFTLVEIAIAAVIIGLLIGGVLKGQELVQNAKVSRIIADFRSIETAIENFDLKYQAQPGDMLEATNRLANCTAGNFCQNGDGNGVIGAPDSVTDVYNWQSRLSIADTGMESYQLWKHLAMSDMISGVDPSANPATPSWGFSHPSSPVGGGYEVYYDASTVSGGVGHFLRMSSIGLSLDAWSNLVLSSISARIDRKIDDGTPNDGYLRANYGTTTDDCKVDTGTLIIYNEAADSRACTLFLLVKRR